MNDRKIIIPDSARQEFKHSSNKGKNTYTDSSYQKKSETEIEYYPNRLEKLRKALFMSQKELCTKANVAPYQYNNIITGKRVPHEPVMLRLAKALAVEPPCDIYIFPNEVEREIVHKAWETLNSEDHQIGSLMSNLMEDEREITEEEEFEGEEPVEASETVSKPSSDTSSYELEEGLTLPSVFSEDMAIDAAVAIGEFLTDDEGIDAKKFSKYVNKWLEDVKGNRDVMNAVITRLSESDEDE